MAAETHWTELLEVVNEASLGVVAIDAEFSIRAVTDDILRRTGHARNEVVGSSVLDLFHPVDIGRIAAVIGRTASDAPVLAPGIFRIRTDVSTWDLFELTVSRINTGEDDAIIIDFASATTAARAESLADDAVELTQLLVEPGSLRHSCARTADFAERNVDRLSLAITIFSEDGTATTFCHRDLDADTTDMNAAAHPLSLPPHVVEAYSKARISTWRSDSEVGTIVPGRLDRVTMVLLDLEDNLLGYVDAFRPSTAPPAEAEWRVYRLAQQVLRAKMLSTQLDHRLEFLSRNDPLTGLTGRHRLLEMMSKGELAGSGVLVINLDGFSWVNSSLGYEAGDTVLTAVAASLLAFVPDRAVAARLSADEFVVWLPTVEHETEVFRLAEQLRKVISVPIDNDDRRSRTRCSIGATRALPDEAPDDTIHRAVAGMAEAKAQGGDRVSHC